MLSIIMPVYNTGAYLEPTVSSVLAQTYGDFELIMVDDGSTDGSGALCDTLALKDRRIRVIHKKNGGVASARNAGLDGAAGDYIGWVDSDDLVSPVMFQVMMGLAQRHDADIVQCSHVRQPELLSEQTEPEQIEILGPVDSLKRIYRSHYTNSCALWSKIYRRSLFDGLRFTEGAAFEDDEVVPLLLERGQKNMFFELPLYCYVKRESSIITSPKVENIMALTAHLENRMNRFRELDEELYRLGRNGFFNYLKGKSCEPWFLDTPVRQQAVTLLKKYRKVFWSDASIYDKIALWLLYFPGGAQWVAQSGFEPIQDVLRKIRGSR